MKADYRAVRERERDMVGELLEKGKYERSAKIMKK